MIKISNTSNTIRTKLIGNVSNGTLFNVLDDYYVKMDGNDIGNSCIRLNSGDRVLFSNGVVCLPLKCNSMFTLNSVEDKTTKLKRLKKGDTFIYDYHFHIVVDCWLGEIRYYDLISHKVRDINPKNRVVRCDVSINGYNA